MNELVTTDRICEYCKISYRKPYYTSRNNWLKRRFCSGVCRSHTMAKIRKVWNTGKKGRIPWNKGKKMSLEYRSKLSLSHMTTGSTPRNKLARSSTAFKDWRESVFKRDNYICRACLGRGGNLHPHHIASFADYSEFRFDPDNGLTLCSGCHWEFHKRFGLKNFISANIILMLPLWKQLPVTQ